MKQITARQFRTAFGSLEEPVIVQRRDAAGTIHLLGEWHPYVDGAAKRAAYEAADPSPIRAAGQAQRDKILAKISKDRGGR